MKKRRERITLMRGSSEPVVSSAAPAVSERLLLQLELFAEQGDAFRPVDPANLKNGNAARFGGKKEQERRWALGSSSAIANKHSNLRSSALLFVSFFAFFASLAVVIRRKRYPGLTGDGHRSSKAKTAAGDRGQTRKGEVRKKAKAEPVDTIGDGGGKDDSAAAAPLQQQLLNVWGRCLTSCDSHSVEALLTEARDALICRWICSWQKFGTISSFVAAAFDFDIKKKQKQTKEQTKQQETANTPSTTKTDKTKENNQEDNKRLVEDEKSDQISTCVSSSINTALATATSVYASASDTLAAPMSTPRLSPSNSVDGVETISEGEGDPLLPPCEHLAMTLKTTTVATTTMGTQISSERQQAIRDAEMVAEYSQSFRQSLARKGFVVDERVALERACRRVDLHEKERMDVLREVRHYQFERFQRGVDREQRQKLHRESTAVLREEKDWASKLAAERSRCISAVGTAGMWAAAGAWFVRLLKIIANSGIGIRESGQQRGLFWMVVDALFGECVAAQKSSADYQPFWQSSILQGITSFYYKVPSLEEGTCFVNRTANAISGLLLLCTAMYVVERLPRVVQNAAYTAFILLVPFGTTGAEATTTILLYLAVWLSSVVIFHVEFQSVTASLKKKEDQEGIPSSKEFHRAVEWFGNTCTQIQFTVPAALIAFETLKVWFS